MRGIVGLIAALLTLAALVVGIFVVQWVTAPARGKLAAREQIQSGSNRIQAYEHFYDLCASVQGVEGALDAQQAELVGSTGDDRDRIRANIAGLAAQRARSIADYNVDARKGYTEGQFRASDLPYQLPTAPYTKGAPTSCVA